MTHDRVSWKSGDAELDAESRRVRRRLACANVGCLSGTLLIAAFWAVFYAPHDVNCWKLQRQFSRLSHPSGTHLVSRLRDVGLLIANSNHIDYFSGEVRSYSGSRDAIRRFYKDKTVWNPIVHDRYDVRLLFVDEFKLDDMTDLSTPDPAIDLAAYWKRDVKRRSHLYIIYVLDSGYDVGLDVRGC